MMNREIKFRAWDKKLGKWSYEALIYEIYGINCYTDYDWCQYTGSKDKNNVEIYEGDIVKGINTLTSLEPFIIGDIRYINNGFAICEKYRNHIMTYYSLEVIGNIYENPELLESEE